MTSDLIGAHPDDETFGIGGTLAKYASDGVNVYYICATRGEVGEVSTPELMTGYSSLGDLRWAELKCAAQALGLNDVIYLGYRDSGMAGSEDNNHPQALAAAPLVQVTERIVKEIRRLKPEVVITFDPIGGYRHPDHIAVHNATVKAFHASGDFQQFPEADTPFQPQKLYFHVFSNKMLKIIVKLLPLFRRDPHRFGRNKDIDLVSLVEIEFPINAVIHLTSKSVSAREKATACHTSQLGGGSPRRGILSFLTRLFGQKDTFIRAYPPVINRRRESDLFAGVK
ncbi:MAG: PIG-L family deacetylase [Dehalococcoidales bacterium]|nr:PIG-L family deacetylase [Dehalococcoidales bacterium]